LESLPIIGKVEPKVDIYMDVTAGAGPITITNVRTKGYSTKVASSGVNPAIVST